MKKILFDDESVKILTKTFFCHHTTVRRALNGTMDSDLVRRIRKRAIDIGLREKGEEKATILK